MKVKPNTWLDYGYEGWFDGEFVFEIGEGEISLDKPYRYGRRILAQVIGLYVALEAGKKDMETLFSLLSETKEQKQK